MMYRYELTGGNHEETLPNGKTILYKKGDIILSVRKLDEQFRGKFRRVSGKFLDDYLVSEERIKPPKDSEIKRMGKKKFSILICTLEDRKDLLKRLLRILKPQMVDSVEIIIQKDSGEKTTGKKRNKLLRRANGDYVAFVDDDDVVSINYVSKILWALQENPDCCSLQGLLIRENVEYSFFHSLKYKKWFKKRGIYYRSPNHLNAIKRELALQVRFPNKNEGEDRDFSFRVRPLLKTEVVISGVLYYYLKIFISGDHG